MSERVFDIEKCYAVLNSTEGFEQYISTEVKRKIGQISVMHDYFSKNVDYYLKYWDCSQNKAHDTVSFESMLDEYIELLKNHEQFEIHEVLLIMRYYSSYKLSNKNNKVIHHIAINYRNYFIQTRAYIPGTK